MWSNVLKEYHANRAKVRRELERQRTFAQIPVSLPNGATVTLSPCGQNPLIKQIVEQFCSRFTPGGTVLYLSDTATKFKHLEGAALQSLGVVLDRAARIPDVVAHDTKRNWLVLIEAVATGGVIGGKRRNDLKQFFKNSTAGLVFVTAFDNRRTTQGVRRKSRGKRKSGLPTIPTI